MAEKRRRIRFHRKLSLVLALTLSVIIAFIILKRSAFLPYQLNNFVNEHYFKDTPFRFSCRKIKGDFINRVTLERPVLEYNDGQRHFTVFKADDVTLDYHLAQILKLKLVVDELMLNNVHLQVEQDESGRVISPLLVLADSAAGEGLSPHVEVQRFGIAGMKLFFSQAGRKLQIRDVSLSGSLKYVNNDGSLEIESGSGYLLNSETSVHSLRAHADFRSEYVRLKDFVIRLDRSFVIATGEYRNGELGHLQLVFNPVDLKEISDMGLLPENTGELGGSVIFDGPLNSLAMRGSLTGSGWGLIFGGLSFSGVLAGDSLSLASVKGDVFGSYIDGQLKYRMGEGGGYSFQGFCRDLDLSQGFLPGGAAPETDLYGQIAVDFSKADGTWIFETDLDSSVVNGFESDQLKVSGRWLDDRGLEFEQIEFVRPGFTVACSGTIDKESRTDLLFELRGDRLDYLWEYLSLPQIDGIMDVRGRITNKIGQLQINLNGDFRNAGFLFASIDSGSVQAQVNNAPSESSNVRVDLRGERIFLSGRQFSDPHVLLEATPEGIMIKDFSFAKGDTLVTMDFDVRQDSTGSLATFKHISIITRDEEWNAERPVDLFLTERGMQLDSLVLASGQGTVGLQGSYSTEPSWCQLWGWGDNIDLSLFRDALDLPISFYGRSRFHAMVEGEIESPKVDLYASMTEGAIDSLSFDRLDFQGTFTPGNGYRLNRLAVVKGVDSLSASGWWRFLRWPYVLLKESIDSEAAFENPFALHLKSHHFPLSDIFRALHLDLRPKGRFSGDLILEKTPADPKARLAGKLLDIKPAGVHMPEVICEFQFEDSTLYIEKLEFGDGTIRGEIEGIFPVAFGVSTGVELKENTPLRIEGSVESKDLSNLSRYFDQIATASGAVSGIVHIGGTLREPSLSGDVSFRNCGLRLSGMEEVYSDINARIELLDQRIQLVSLTGQEGKRGSFRGLGFLDLDRFKVVLYKLDFYFNDFVLASIPDFSSTQDGSIAIISHEREDGSLIPHITGSITVKQAQMLRMLGRETGNEAPASRPTVSPSWMCDVEIDAPKNVWVRNPDLRIELGGDVILKRDETGLYLRGELEILRGTYMIYNNKFRITEGTFDFSKANAFRPEMFLNAYTPYRREGDREHRIYLNLAWPIDKKEPQVTLSYDEPGYSETDIWKMLGGTYISPTAQSGDTWDAAGTAQNIASNYLERILNAQMTDVTIDIESHAQRRGSFSTDWEREMSIAVGKYFYEDLYLKYRQGISMGSDREVDVEYRISNMIIIHSEIIRHSGKLFLGQRRQATDEINLDVKLRFEY